REAQLVSEAWPKIVESMTDEGDGYSKARQAFGVLLATHGRAMYVASRYIGGVHVSRSHKGDANAPAPFESVSADRQRAAMDLVAQQVFSDEPFLVPSDIYGYLAPTRWSHWGSRVPTRTDYPIHEVILMWQSRILDRLMSPLTLERLHDSELKAPAEDDAFTTAELLDRLTQAIFGGLKQIDTAAEFTTRKPAVSSLDRNLQRAYLERLIRLSLRNSFAPQDCQTLAYVELRRLLDLTAVDGTNLDAYSRAHLIDTKARIERALNARMIDLP
ncbi:MAG: zinc-dependent metalloprotease, partial [Planctomycetota bacterium]